MLNLIAYNHKYFIKSLKFIPQSIFFLTMLAVVYYQKTDNIFSSYSLSVMFLFITITWLVYTFVNIENNIHRGIVIIHSKNPVIYYISKIVYLFIIDILLSTVSSIFPIAIGAFKSDVSLKILFIIFLCHLASGLFGISIGLFFDSRIIGQKKFSVIALIAIMLCAVLLSKILFGNFDTFASFLVSPIGFLIEKITLQATQKTAYSLILSIVSLNFYALLFICIFVFAATKLPQS